MPVIVFEGPKLERTQKAQLVKELSDVGHRVTGIRREAFVVFVKENDPENIGVGGSLLADRPPQPK